MDLIAAEKLSLDLMTLHGLVADGWVFKFSRATNAVGQCFYSRKLISLSKDMALISPAEDIRQVMLHEIAHALTPVTKSKAQPKSGKRPSNSYHGADWLAKAKSIGYTGGRCTDPTSVYSMHMIDIEIQKRVDKRVKLNATRKPVRSSARRYTVPAPAPRKLDKGDRVKTLGSHRSLSGKIGVIVGTGKSRYRVKFDDGLEIYAPYDMVVKVD